MNLVRASIITITVLIIIFGGVLTYTIVFDEDDDNIPEPIEPVDTPDEPVLSTTPSGIIEHDNRTLTINEEELLVSHIQEIQRNSTTIQVTEDSNRMTYTTSGDGIVRMEGEQFGHETAQYSADRYTITRNERISGDVSYEASVGSIERDSYTMENNFETLLRELSVDNYDQLNNTTTEIRLIDGNETTHIEHAYGLDKVNSATVTVEITNNGVIRYANIEIVGEKDGLREAIRKEYSVENMGAEPVSEPNWLTDAETQVSIVDGEYDKEQGWVILEHHGFATVPESEGLTIFNPETRTSETIPLPADFEEGDILGLRFTDSGWEATINEEPEVGIGGGPNMIMITSGDGSGQEYFQIDIRDES